MTKGMKISEIIKDKYKLRIPPTVYYDLLADVQEIEEEQEPIVEIDLYSVIKQKYIEREVLDKIRAELESKLDNINRLYNQDNQYDDGAIDSLQYALDIIDKYKGETENT
jgi:hypothetical protein